MKVYISADIEGVTGVTHWDETEKPKADHKDFAHQMTLEVKAACEGAINGGADEIWIKDAHDSGRNIDHNLLPKNTKLIRGWSGHIFSMVQELNETFDAVIFVGYHSSGGTNTNPLSHTMNTQFDYIKLNGEIISEFLIHAYIANYFKVPVVFLSGDLGICDEAKRINEHIMTIPVKEGIGNSTINIHPQLAIDLIKNGVEKSLKRNFYLCNIELPREFELEIKYKEHAIAYRKSSYPNVEQIGPKAIRFISKDYMEVLKAIEFLV